ncbi:SPARC-like protein 1 [Ambystoma mexicanum]|uniref:SPARC-like protein 1 n=1 Tax=Ambystoma mexicanum TaxID=8296 RepID=UPI0037E96102
MKTVIFTVCLLGAAFAIPTRSFRHHVRERRHHLSEKDERDFPDTSKEKDFDEYRSNTTDGNSDSHEKKMRSSESNQDQSDSQIDILPEQNGQTYNAQNNSGYRGSPLDNYSLLSQDMLKALEPAESPTVSQNESQSNTERDKTVSGEENSLSKEDASKESKKDRAVMQLGESMGTPWPDSSESQEADAWAHSKRAPVAENYDDDEEEASEDVDSDEKQKDKLVNADDYSQLTDLLKASIYSDPAVAESSHISRSLTQGGMHRSQMSILETNMEGEQANTSSNESEQGTETERMSQDDINSDQNKSEMEETEKRQSLYENVFPDATDLDNEHKRENGDKSEESKTSMEINEEHKRSEDGIDFPANKNLDGEGQERLITEDVEQENGEGDDGVDTNETGEDRRLRSRIQTEADTDMHDQVNTTSLERMHDSSSESKEHVASFASLDDDKDRLSDQEKMEIIVDPCKNFRCKRGKTCEANEEGTPMCVCRDVVSCPPTIIFDQVCGTDNQTYNSECHLFGTKCQLEETKNGSHLHLDYRGSCKHIPPCSEHELAQFPLRMRDWLKNVLVQLYESDLDVSGILTEKQRNKVKKKYLHEKRLMNGNHTLDLLLRDFQKNYHMYVYPVHWQFSQLDLHPADRRLSHSELAPLRVPLVPMEHCITEFFKECNTDNNKYVSLKEWCLCFGIKEEDIREDLLF